MLGLSERILPSLTVTGDRAGNAVRHLKRLIRASWSNPPHHGAAVVALILEEPERRAEWERELRKIRERTTRLRRLLFAALRDHGVPGDHDHILKERSVFTRLPLSPGQAGRLRKEHGELTLSAAAEESFDIVVDRITPVSQAGEGANYFQVEASLVETPAFLRPGMQGVSKISIGERQLLWIWTHKLVDWLRLKLWAWF